MPLVGGTDIHFHRRPALNTIRIACVGDSITNGALIPGCFFRSYPAQLAKLLGSKYHVENYGLNDRTLQSTATLPYVKEPEFGKSLSFKPDIAVIMLGTNDTKEVNWRSVEKFEEEYAKLIKEYQLLSSKPRIVLCIPPWSINAENALMALTNDTDARLLPQVAEGVRRVAEQFDLPVIDFYTLFEGRRELLSHDGVHPNATGAKLIAETVKSAISELSL